MLSSSGTEEDSFWEWFQAMKQLGEYDVETRLGPIVVYPPEEAIDYERHAIAELPRLFDRLVAGLEGSTGSPS